MQQIPMNGTKNQGEPNMKKWNKLDNAAKIFPSTIEQSETRVFRFYCQLTKDVQPEALQQAVDRAVRQFPHFLKILRKGLFWYYLENSSKRPKVEQESQSPCSHIYKSGHHELLFKISYFKKRINLEIFHVLADGAGAIEFLKFILAAYFNILYPGTLPVNDPLIQNPLSITELDSDAFEEYYTGEKDPRSKKKGLVWLLKGQRRPDLDINVTEGVVSTKKILELAHTYHTTMTEFLVAVLIKSFISQMSDKELKKSLVIDIPINLRNFFPSETTRNFFAILPVTYKPQSRDDSLETICACISKEFAETITKENLLGKINSLGSFERNVPMRLVPIFLKDPGLQFCNFMAKRFVTGCFSNLGKIVMPECFDPYIEQIGIYSSTLTIQAECCSYKDRLTLGFTEAFTDVTPIYTFFNQLEELGIPVEIHTNTPTRRIQSQNPSSPGQDVYIADPSVDREEKTDDVFPVPKQESHRISNFLRISNIICIIAMITYAIVYLLTDDRNYWFLIMGINTIFIWNGVVRGMLIKSSILRRLFTRFLWTSIFYLAIDLFSGWHQWSLTQQVPVFSLVNLFLSLYLAGLFKTDTSDEELTLYLSLECMMGIVPGILTLFGVIYFSFFTMIISIICLTFLLLMVLFRWRSIKHEYKKTFHI